MKCPTCNGTQKIRPPFEFLLKNLGWVFIDKFEACALSVEEEKEGSSYERELFTPHWHDANAICCWCVEEFYHTYEFISSIEIEKDKDWNRYVRYLVDIVIPNKPGHLSVGWPGEGKALHNASVDDRILAHAKVKGYKG